MYISKEEGARITDKNITCNTKLAKIPTADVPGDYPGKDMLNIKLKCITYEYISLKSKSKPDLYLR